MLCWGKVYKKDATLIILIILQVILTFKMQSFANTDFVLLDLIAVTTENTITLVTTLSFNITSPGRHGQNWGNTTYRAG